MDNILDREQENSHIPGVILLFHGIEGLSVALFVLSILWKLMSWPGTSYLIIGCMVLWAMLTVISPLYAIKAYPDKSRTFVAWTSLWVLAIIYLGFLFGDLNWPYAYEMRLIGAIPVWICGLYFARNIQKFSKQSIESWLIKRMYYRMIPALFTSVIVVVNFLKYLGSNN